MRDSRIEQVNIDELQMTPPGPVGEADRDGIYVHSFQCGECTLHFQTFSWMADRHRCDTVSCPECGGRPNIHHRVILSETTTFDPFGPAEICRLFPWPGSELVEYFPRNAEPITIDEYRALALGGAEPDDEANS